LTILTTATILLFFYGVSYSKDALGYVTLISTAGYLAAGLLSQLYGDKEARRNKEKDYVI